MNREAHWDAVFSRKSPGQLTWYQAEPEVSLSLIRKTGVGPEARILDVGCGTSSLLGRLLDEGYRSLSGLDVSGKALALARSLLAKRGSQVAWHQADLTRFDPPTTWDLWHDRAVFHFLTDPGDQEAYRNALERALAPKGHVIIGGFAPDGPTKCSGLDVVRHSRESLAAVLGDLYEWRDSVEEIHSTPRGGTQAFLYLWFQRNEERG